MIPEFFPHDRPSPGEFSKDCRGWACHAETVFAGAEFPCNDGLFRKNSSKACPRILFVASHAAKSISKINAGTFQLHSLTGRQRKTGRGPGRAGGLSLSIYAGAACHNCFASNALKPVDERFSNRALKQIGFEMLPPVFNGVSRWPLAHPENRRLLFKLAKVNVLALIRYKTTIFGNKSIRIVLC